MKFTSKISKNGNSYFILVPKSIIKDMELNGFVEVSIDSLKNNNTEETIALKSAISVLQHSLKSLETPQEETLLHLRCKVCQHQFDAVKIDGSYYCPACDEQSCEEVDIDDVSEDE